MAFVESDNQSCRFVDNETCISPGNYCVDGRCARRMFIDLPDGLSRFHIDLDQKVTGYIDVSATVERIFDERISDGFGKRHENN